MRADDFLDSSGADAFLDGAPATPRQKPAPSFKDQVYSALNGLFRADASVMDRFDGPTGQAYDPVATAKVDRIIAQPVARALPELPESVGVVEKGVRGGVAQLGKAGAGAVQMAADALGLEGVSDFAAGAARQADRFASAPLRKTQIEGFTPNSIVQDLPQAGAGAISSTITTLPSLVAGVMAPGAALPTLAATVQPAEYTEGRAGGLNPLGALLRSVPMTGAEVIGEKLGGLNKITAGIRAGIDEGSLVPIGRAMVASGARETPSELATTAMQFGIDKLPGVGLNQEATAADLQQQLKDTALQTVLQSAGMAGVGGAISGKPDVQQQQAEPQAAPADIRALTDAIAQSASIESRLKPKADDFLDEVEAVRQAVKQTPAPQVTDADMIPRAETAPKEQANAQAVQPAADAARVPADAGAVVQPVPAAVPDAAVTEATNAQPAPQPAADPADAAQPADPVVAGNAAPAFELPAQLTERAAQIDKPTEGLRPGDIVAASGKPFKTKAQAQAEAKAAGKGWQVKKGGGGFVVRYSPPSAAQLANAKRLVKAQTQIDTERDSLFAAIAKLGGIHPDALTKEWGFDPKEIASLRGAGIKRVANRNGRSLDSMAEALAELGYLSYDENGKHDVDEFFELFDGEIRGNKHYTPQGFERQAQASRDAEFAEWEARRIEELSEADIEASAFDQRPDEAKDAIEEALDRYEELTAEDEAALENRIEREAIRADSESVVDREAGEDEFDPFAEEGSDRNAAEADARAPRQPGAAESSGDTEQGAGRDLENYPDVPFSRSGVTNTPEFRRWFGDSKVVDENGDPLVVYHGTSADFDAFSASAHRSVLNNKYQGDGFHFSASPEVAGKYSDAARNQFLNKEKAFAAVEREMPPRAAAIFREVVEDGYAAAWDKSDADVKAIINEASDAGIDLNDLLDIAEWVAGSNYDKGSSRSNSFDAGMIFGGRSTWLPDWVRESAVKFGMEDSLPNPAVMPVYLKAENILRTDDPQAAKRAQADGYDGVYYSGPGTVDGEPEWIVFRPEQIKSATGNRGTYDPANPDITMSRGSGSGLTADAVRAAIAADIFHQEVDVYQSIADTPDYVRRQAEREGADDVEGFFDPRTNRVALIASNLSSAERAREVARHELIGHYGIENMVGREEMARLTARVIQAEKDGNKVIRELAELVDRTQPDLDAKRRAKEIIAVMAERNIQNSITKRVIDAIRKFLKDIGFIQSDITDAEIAGLLRDAQAYLRDKGREMVAGDPAPAFSRAAASLDMDAALTAQPAAARRALSKEMKRLRAEAWQRGDADPDGAPERMTGRELVERISERLGSESEALEYLKALGVAVETDAAYSNAGPTALEEGRPLTREEVLVKQEADAKAAKEEAKKPTAPKQKNATADQVDMFAEQGSLFSRSGDNGDPSAAAPDIGEIVDDGKGPAFIRGMKALATVRTLSGAEISVFRNRNGELEDEYVARRIIDPQDIAEFKNDGDDTWIKVRDPKLPDEPHPEATRAAQSMNAAADEFWKTWKRPKASGRKTGDDLDLDNREPFTARDFVSTVRDVSGRRQWAAGTKAYDRLTDVIEPMLAKVKLSDSAPAAFKQMMRDFQSDQQKALANARKVAEIGTATLTPEERVLVSDIIEKNLGAADMPPEHVAKLAADIDAALKQQAQDLVDLGMATDDRLIANYLPRAYRNPLLARITSKEQFVSWYQKARLRINGNRLKSRGLINTVAIDDIAKFQKLGWKISSMTDGEAIPADLLRALESHTAIPPQYATKDMKVLMWRDFTADERAKMGEIRDGILRYAIGYTETQRDIAIGRLFKALADNDELSSKVNPGGWTKVPDQKIPGTELKRYGALSGLYVPPYVRDVIERSTQPKGPLMQMYDRALNFWKEGKTVWNPVAHGNNVISNVFVMHFAGLNPASPKPWRKTIQQYRTKGRYYQEAVDHGLFGTEFASRDIQELFLPELTGELDAETVMASRFNKVVEFLKKTGKPVAWYRDNMQKAYEFEDQFFKLMLFIDRRENGASIENAIDDTERYIFNYSDVPEGVNLIKRTVSPFFSYTYKALPMVLHTAMTRPDRLLLPVMLLGGANWLAYALMGGDEEEERAGMPEYMQGRTFIGTHKSVRMPFNIGDRPAFMDMTRRVPLGDLFDLHNQTGGVSVPAPFMPSHPLFTATAAMLFNIDTFTGRDLVMKSDTGGEAAQKRVEWIYKQIAPNAPFVPGSWNFDKLMNGAANAFDTEMMGYTGYTKAGDPIPLATALLDVAGGTKIRSFDPERGTDFQRSAIDKEFREISANIRSAARNKAMSDDARNEYIAEQKRKQDELKRERAALK